MRVIVSEELEIKNDSCFERCSIQKQLRDVNFEYCTNQLAIKDNLEAKHKAQRNQIFVNILSRAVNKKESLYFNQWKLATKFQNKRLFTLRRLLYLFEAKATKKSLNLWIKLIRNQKDFKTEEYISSCISSHETESTKRFKKLENMTLSIHLKEEANGFISKSIDKNSKKCEKVIKSLINISHKFIYIKKIEIMFMKWKKEYSIKKDKMKILVNILTKLYMRNIFNLIKIDAQNESEVFQIIKSCRFIYHKLKHNHQFLFFSKWRSNIFKNSRLLTNDKIQKKKAVEEFLSCVGSKLNINICNIHLQNANLRFKRIILNEWKAYSQSKNKINNCFNIINQKSVRSKILFCISKWRDQANSTKIQYIKYLKLVSKHKNILLRNCFHELKANCCKAKRQKSIINKYLCSNHLYNMKIGFEKFRNKICATKSTRLCRIQLGIAKISKIKSSVKSCFQKLVDVSKLFEQQRKLLKRIVDKTSKSILSNSIKIWRFDCDRICIAQDIVDFGQQKLLK